MRGMKKYSIGYVFMQTIRDIKNATQQYGKTHPTDVYKNRNVRVTPKSVIEYLDEEDNVYKEIICSARDTSKDNAALEKSTKSTKKTKTKKKKSAGKKTRTVILRVWPTKTNNYNDNSWIHVSCTCEFFKYYCDEALWLNHSSWAIEKGKAIDAPFDANPSKNQGITNPNLMTWVCKHIATALRANFHKKIAKNSRKKDKPKKPILLSDTFF